jgi:salicylate hydroxylase
MADEISAAVGKGSRGGRPLRVAIVGGGIGGLFAAHAMRRHGFDVHVYEQAHELTEVGAGFSLSPNGVRLLEWIGVGPEVWRLGAPASPEKSRYMRHDGTMIGQLLTTDSNGWNAVMGMHRADLVDILAEKLPSEMVHTNHRCVGLEQDEESVHLQFADGKEAEADVVVGADGIHSVIANYADKPAEAIYAGSVAYRGIVPSGPLEGWLKDESLIWMGAGKHFMVFPVRHYEAYCYVGFLPSDESLAESWTAPGDASVLEREYADWDPVLPHLISQIDQIFGWGLYDRLPREQWSNGRVTLLGDAAHAMLPHAGQGANQAIEDGAALAHLLAKIDDPVAALKVYEELRLPRTTEVQAGSRQGGRQQKSEYADLNKRDAEVRSNHDFRYWLYDYDAIAEAEKAAAAVNA